MENTIYIKILPVAYLAGFSGIVSVPYRSAPVLH